MAKSHELAVQLRKDEGKGASRRLRRAKRVPAIVYGGELAPVSIDMDHKDVFFASEHEWFYSAILDLNLDGDVQQVLLRDMQRHPYKQQILHLDFMRVTAGQEIRIRIPVHFLNQDESPAGKTSNVVITHEMTEVEVTCMPKNLPEFIELDLSKMEVGDTVHLSELKLPEGVEIPALKLGEDHDSAIAVARFAKEEVEDEPETDEADGDAVDGDAAESGEDDDSKS
ncbi:MAG: 50S ribosomal protein L25/general stress protein Ctc [Dokdonella sp.]